MKNNTLTIAGEEKALQPGSADSLQASLTLNARLAGIDAEKLGKRLETGAANAREEEAWVKSDLSDVARRHGYDLDTPQGRSAAAERLDRFYQRAAELIQSGVQVIVLLALSDEGAPAYDHQLAAKLAALGAPAFACTPEQFPELMAAAIRREDVALWAAKQGLVTARAKG